MRRIKALRGAWLVGAVSGLAACGSPDTAGQYVGDNITSTDFENLRGWGADVSALTQEHAHSGSYATFVGPNREFSLTFQLPLAQASVHAIKAVEVSAWVYMPTVQSNAALVVQVLGAGGVSHHYALLRLREQVQQPNKWQPVKQVFELPPGLPADSNLRLYLWRDAGTESAYLDDLTMKARE